MKLTGLCVKNEPRCVSVTVAGDPPMFVSVYPSVPPATPGACASPCGYELTITFAGLAVAASVVADTSADESLKIVLSW